MSNVVEIEMTRERCLELYGATAERIRFQRHQGVKLARLRATYGDDAVNYAISNGTVRPMREVASPP